MVAFVINTCHIILTCLAVMINLTTMSTCQSTTARVLPMTKHLNHLKGLGMYGSARETQNDSDIFP